ncbi:hypothetical protein CWN98_12555 [Vibrio splendidus]|nr:hypothetical protein CWN98_12555 [Vibrio splendidus]PTP47535.1 hypothetical protein CWO10_12020 [Vibrio splendidus]
MLIFNFNKPNIIILSFSTVMLLYGAGGIFPKVAWIIIISTLLILSIYFIFRRRRVIPIEYAYVFCCATLWLLVPLFFSFYYHDWFLNIKLLLETLLYVIFSIVVCSWMSKDTSRFEVVTSSMTKIWLVTSFLFFVFYISGFVVYENTFSGVYTNRNLFSIVSTLLLICTLCFVEGKSKKITYATLLIICVLSTASIKGLIGVLLVIYTYQMKNFRLYKVFGFSLLLSFFVFIVIQSDTLISQRLSSLIDVLNSFDLSGMGSASERLWLIVNGSELAFDHLDFGIGLYNSKYYLFPPWQLLKAERVGDVLDVGLYTHMNYLEVLLSTGLFGFLAYYLPHLLIFFRSKSGFRYNINLRFCWVFIVYKLFLDVGMVSYNSFPLVFFYVFSLILIFNYNKGVSSNE